MPFGNINNSDIFWGDNHLDDADKLLKARKWSGWEGQQLPHAPWLVVPWNRNWKKKSDNKQVIFHGHKDRASKAQSGNVPFSVVVALRRQTHQFQACRGKRCMMYSRHDDSKHPGDCREPSQVRKTSWNSNTVRSWSLHNTCWLYCKSRSFWC